jgi:ubiquinone/menaquinone biosynthesis C-methylase UbiE
MPFSSNLCKAEIREWLREMRPDTILDIGAGSGVYSRLFRPILPWTTWVALEIHEPYVERYDLKLHYEQVIVENVLNANIGPATFDVVVLGDVLEHMTLNDAASALRRAQIWATKGIIASVPLGYCPQEPSEGNEHEAHISEWTHKSFLEFVHDSVVPYPDSAVVRKDSEYTIGAYLWRK